MLKTFPAALEHTKNMFARSVTLTFAKIALFIANHVGGGNVFTVNAIAILAK